jgi:hypothetical protein
MARRVSVEGVMHQIGKLDLPWDLEAGRLDPVFEVTADDVRALTEELLEPDCTATLVDLETALAGLHQAAAPAAVARYS